MKNEQNNQNNKQDNPVKNPGNQKEQGHDKQQQNSNQQNTSQMDQSKTNQSTQGQGNGNIAVDNDGKIGKAHQWDNDNNNRNENNKKNEQVRSDKTNTAPEIDAPIYDPEKTEKKIPQMQGNKDKK